MTRTNKAGVRICCAMRGWKGEGGGGGERLQCCDSFRLNLLSCMVLQCVLGLGMHCAKAQFCFICLGIYIYIYIYILVVLFYLLRFSRFSVEVGNFF
jgi:hypothetical protein